MFYFLQRIPLKSNLSENITIKLPLQLNLEQLIYNKYCGQSTMYNIYAVLNNLNIAKPQLQIYSVKYFFYNSNVK